MRDQPKSFKAIFDNFFEEPTREKLRELLRENLGEFAYCDFKATWIEPSKLSRHIIAMANSGRGCLIFGVAENTDGTNDPIGLSALTDKKEIFEKIEKYIPSQLMDSIDILDFSYDASEYQKLIGKKFQVLFVDDNPEHLPFISLSEGPGIKKHAIYIRHNDGPESEEANYDEIQKIIDRRLETGYPSGKEIDLRIHLEQLKILFSQIDRTFFSGPIFDSYVRSLSSAISGFTGESNPNPNYPTEDFEAFIIKVIAKKKRRIELELDTLGMQ